MRRLLIARNPDPESTLPYLIRVPIDDGLVLKAHDSWPRTNRVYCHREPAWPEQPEILEDVPVLQCRRRGVAIDLVLDRPRENRSQLVFTRLPSGREGIFWQTRKVVTRARPGARIPGRRVTDLGSPFTIVVDTRERYPYRFVRQQVTIERVALTAGDYAVRSTEGRVLAAVERKSIADLSASLNNGTLVFELSRLAELERAAIVVEDRYSTMLRNPRSPTGFLPDLLARVQVRYPEIPIVFMETRPLAEEWTYRWLGAALVELTPPTTPGWAGPAEPAGLFDDIEHGVGSGADVTRTALEEAAPMPPARRPRLRTKP